MALLDYRLHPFGQGDAVNVELDAIQYPVCQKNCLSGFRIGLKKTQLFTEIFKNFTEIGASRESHLCFVGMERGEGQRDGEWDGGEGGREERERERE